MKFDFAAAKAEARRAVHDVLSVDAVYQDVTMPEPVPVTVRWHNKIARFGDLEGAGYAEVISGIDRLLFNRELLRASGVTLRQSGVVTIVNPLYDNAKLILSAQDPIEGPVDVIWEVGKIGGRNQP